MHGIRSDFYIYLLWQVRCRVRFGGATQERHARVDGDVEGVAQRAQEEPLPHERGEDNVGNNHEDDADAGFHVVREREEEAEEGEQDDVGAEEQDGRRRRRVDIG